MEQKTLLIESTNSDGTAVIEENLSTGAIEISSINDTFDLMSSSEIHHFFLKVSSLVSETASQLCDDEDSVCDIADESEQRGVLIKAGCVSLLRKIVAIILKRMESTKDNHTSMLGVVEVLHDLLIPLDDTVPGALSLKVTIARICEKWWISERDGAENLVTQLLPYLLIAGLSPTAHDSDVKRLYAIRTTLQLLDFDDDSIESIRSLLLRCFISPAFLRVPDGKRFLSYLFSVHEGLISTMLEVMKPQIAAGSKGVPTAYGEVLFRAWKDTAAAAAAGGTKNNGVDTSEAIEEGVQGLFHDALHAEDKKYFKGLRVVLGAFHESKRYQGVDTFLLRTYGPILWRSLRCANALVRAQATMLFFDAFPLQGSDSSAVESDVILQKQFGLLTSLLKDADHRVRAAAASGVCHVLREYWEALPTQTTKQILSYVVGTLGHDSTCAVVRLAVVRGLGEVLDQPLSHLVLKSLLPLIADALHDKSMAVRVAFIEVLNKVKNTRGLHFCQIVTVDQLQKQLAQDVKRPAACRALTSLLLNSYYPQNKGDGDRLAGTSNTNSVEERNHIQIERCLLFIKENLSASIAFYGSFSQFASVGSAAKLVLLLSALLGKEKFFEDHCNPSSSTSSSTADKKSKRDRESDEADTAQNEDPRSTSAFIPGPRALKIGVMHVMLSSLSSIASQLREDENETAKNLLLKYFTPDSVQQKFEILCGESDGVESNPEDALIASQLVPLFMQIVSIIWKLKDDEKIAKKKGVSNTVIGLDPCKLLLHFTKYTQLHPKQACIHTYGAATVEILKTLNSDEMLFDAINTPLKHLLATVRGSNHPSTLRALEICSSPEPQSLRGNVGGKRKPKNASSPGVEKKENTKNVPNFELESSIVLLGAVLNSDRKLLSSEQEATLFLSIRNTINSILLFEKKMEGPWVSDVSNFVRCAYLWALSALKEASLNATEHSSTNSNNSMDGLLSWIKGNLLPSFCHTENTPYFQIGNGGKNGDRGQKKKSSDLEGILSPAMKFPPRSRVRLGTPGKDLKLNGNNTSTSFGFLVGVQVMQVMLLVLSDAIVMNILITEVIDLMLIIAENISNSPEKIKIVNALRQILMRMSALLSPSGEKSGLVVKKIENLVKDSDNEQRKEEVINDSSNDENDENERNKNVSNNEIENDENQKVRNEGDNGVFRTPGNIKLAVNSMTNTPVKNIFPSGIDDDFTRLSMESKTNEL